MPRYIEVVAATTETATKILALRAGSLRGTRRDVRVTTNGGRTASVNWFKDLSQVTLNMPSLPPDAVLTRAEADRLVAFIGHECCHVLHSDKDAWERAVQAGARVRDWTNALEDVRIEAKEIRAGAFPALGGLLASMANHLHYESVVASRKHRKVIGAKVADAPYVACILGRLANGYAIPAAAGLAGGMSDRVRQLMDVALPGVKACRSTDAVRLLAEQLVAMERAMLPPPAPPNQPDDQGDQGDDDRGNEGDDDQGDGQPGDQGDGQPGDQGDGPGDQDNQGSQGDGGQGDGETAPQGRDDTATGDDGDEGPATDADLSKAIDAIAERAGIKNLERHAELNPAHQLATIRSTIADPLAGLATDRVMNTAAAATLTERLPRNSVLHGQIGRLLVSSEVRRVTHHESSGRLDRRALARMRTGATDVFSRRDDTPGIDTALMILIDGSSSMNARSIYIKGHDVITGPSRMELAQTAAWHIARAAEAANARVCVGVFNTQTNSRGTLVRGAAVTIIKPWDVQAQDRAAALGAVSPSGATPMSPAIIECGRMLADVSATRRILMVLTDGECDYGPDAVTRACTLADDVGVETVGVGMACASVIDAFPPRYSVNVEDLDQLAGKGLGVLVSMLEDANPRGAD